MLNKKMQVEVNNVTDGEEKYVVARFDEHSKKLWYFGRYETEERAKEVALIENGIVLEDIK